MENEGLVTLKCYSSAREQMKCWIRMKEYDIKQNKLSEVREIIGKMLNMEN